MALIGIFNRSIFLLQLDFILYIHIDLGFPLRIILALFSSHFIICIFSSTRVFLFASQLTQ